MCVPAAAGIDVTVIKNATGVFVRGPRNSVKVVLPDLQGGFGIVHVVSGVLAV